MMSRKDFLKSHVLSWQWKEYSDWEDVTSSGRHSRSLGQQLSKQRYQRLIAWPVATHVIYVICVWLFLPWTLCFFGSGTDLILLLILLSSCWGDCLQKSPRICRFKRDRDEIRQDFSSSKCAFQSGENHAWFHAEKCCHLVNAHTATLGTYAVMYVSSWSIVHLLKI